MRSFLSYFAPPKPRTNLIEITKAEECQKLFSQKLAIIFKHSEACDLSQNAYLAVTRFCDARPDVNVYLISVLDSRNVAVLVEEQTGVRHESPQVIVIQNGTVAANVSHRRITFEFLEKLPVG